MWKLPGHLRFHLSAFKSARKMLWKNCKKKDPHNQNAIQQWKRQTTEHKPQENLTSYPYMMIQIIMAVKRWRTPNSQKNDSSYSTKNLPTQTQPQHQKEQPHNISELKKSQLNWTMTTTYTEKKKQARQKKGSQRQNARLTRHIPVPRIQIEKNHAPDKPDRNRL